MNKKELSFWYWIFWLAVIITVLWIIAKLSGLIQTPLFLEVLPIISGIIAIISLGIILGNNFQKTSFAVEKINKIETRQDNMAHGLIGAEKNIDIIKKDISIMKDDIKQIKENTKR